MAYLHLGVNYYTIDGIINFTNECNSVKLNESTYAGESKQSILKKINLRRKESIAAVEAGVEVLMPSRGQGSKRTAEELESAEWERRVKACEAQATAAALADELRAQVTDLQQRLGASEAVNEQLRARMADYQAANGQMKVSEREALTIIAELEAKASKLEQSLNATRAFIDELEQTSGGVDGQQVADAAETTGTSMVELNATIEKLKAELVIATANSTKYDKEAKLKAKAWDEETNSVISKQLHDANFPMFPRGILNNLAELAGVKLLQSDMNNDIKQKILHATHPDNHSEILAKKVLFERIHQTVIAMKL